MKKQLLSVLMLVCSLCVKIAAQNPSSNVSFQDTIIINISANIKILYIGNDLRDMVKFKNADSLKTIFMSDLQKAKENETFPAESKMIHYFVHPNGKRRLKAENDDYQAPDLNVEIEIRAMNLNLPAFVYMIHDVFTGYQLQIYLNDPKDIVELEEIRLNEAIRLIAADKKELRKYFTIEEKFEYGQWSKIQPFSKKPMFFGIDPVLGVCVFGSKITPEIGIEFSYVFRDKYSVSRFKIGAASRTYFFSEYAAKEFFNFYLVDSYNLNFHALIPNSKSSVGKWAGVEFGFFSAKGGFLANNYKLGFIYAYDFFQIGFDIINSSIGFKNNTDKVLYAFTMRFSL